MTEDASRSAATAVLGIVAVMAGYFILTDPRLRRAAFRLVKVGLTATLPGYLFAEVSGAWKETGRRAA